MHINRGLAFWGVALVTAGAVALAIQSGVLPPATIGDLWRFWPVVLIVIGLAIIAARTPFALVATLLAGLMVGGLAGSLVGGIPEGIAFGCGGETDRRTAADGAFGDSAEVDLELDCGELRVVMGEGDGWNVEARYAGGSEPTISSDAAALRVAGEDDGIGFVGMDDRQSWDVTLPTEVVLDLAVDANAASSTLDLSGSELSELEIDANAGSLSLQLAGALVRRMSVDANAGSVSVTVDESTRLDGSLGINAGSIQLCAPESMSLAITVEDDNITFNHNLDESDLARSGDTWSTDGGDADVTLSIEGNAGGLTLNPEEGCE